MPCFCVAYGCSNERTVESKRRGITFHTFPKAAERRRQWELATKRDGFVASKRAVLCSDHFRPEQFDRTGQIVRLKDGVIPSVFCFPAHLQRPIKKRTTNTSRRAEEWTEAQLKVPKQQGASGEGMQSCKRPSPDQCDHTYALPASPDAVKAKLNEALARVRKLEQEKRNAVLRERRARNNMHALLEELKEKNLINKELTDKLESYADLPVHLPSRRSNKYTKAQREFALALHLHSPQAYNYLRESLRIHLPHPSSLQRCTVQSKAPLEASTGCTSLT